MSRKILNGVISKHFIKLKQFNRCLSSENSIKKVDETQTKPSLLEKLTQSEKTKEKPVRKGPFKYYFDDEERDKNKIVFYENFFGN